MASPSRGGGGGGRGGRGGATSPDNLHSKDDARHAEIQWAEENFGRLGGLALGGVYSATGVATQVIGFAIGDKSFYVRSGFRGLIPLHLRLSARVHHVAFFHPSLDPDVGSGGGGNDKKGYLTNLDVGFLGASSYYAKIGGGGGDGRDGDAALSNPLEDLVLEEKRRLSRDGIIRDHAKRTMKVSRRAKPAVAGGDGAATSSVPTIKGRRKFVQLSADSSTHDRTKKSASSPKAVKEAFFRSKGGKKKSLHRGDSFEGSRRRWSIEKHDLTGQTVIFDEEGVTGDGPLLASVIMESPIAKMGRYIPEVACRVPQNSVGFELTNDARTIKSTQPFVPESPHIIWGGARDAALRKIAEDGNPLLDARDMEYLTDRQLELAERTESLLVIGSTVWVDIPPEVKKDAKTSKDYAKKAEKAAKKGVETVAGGMKKGFAKTTEAAVKGAQAVENTTATVTNTATEGGKKLCNTTAAVANAAAAGGKKLGTQVAMGTHGIGSHNPSEDVFQTTRDIIKAGEAAASASPVTASADDTKTKMKFHGATKILTKTAEKIHLKKKKKKKKKVQKDGNGVDDVVDDCEGDAIESTHSVSFDTDDHDGHDDDDKAADTNAGHGVGETVEEEAVEKTVMGSSPMEMLLPPKPSPYTLVLDDILQFRVVHFPFGGTVAAFPISVAAVLNSVSSEERMNDPRQPSELTVTLVQEPSIVTGRWGVECRVTFRAVEVRPESPLEMEEPIRDEKSGKWYKTKLSDKMKKLAMRLKKMNKSKEEIDAEIRAVEQKEVEEQEAREEAIVKAGIGRGFQHGAPTREIVRRQMFYDPERIAVRRVERRALSDVDAAIIKAMTIDGKGFEHEMIGRRKAMPGLSGDFSPNDQASDGSVAETPYHGGETDGNGIGTASTGVVQRPGSEGANKTSTEGPDTVSEPFATTAGRHVVRPSGFDGASDLVTSKARLLAVPTKGEATDQSELKTASQLLKMEESREGAQSTEGKATDLSELKTGPQLLAMTVGHEDAQSTEGEATDQPELNTASQLLPESEEGVQSMGGEATDESESKRASHLLEMAESHEGAHSTEDVTDQLELKASSQVLKIVESREDTQSIEGVATDDLELKTVSQLLATPGGHETVQSADCDATDQSELKAASELQTIKDGCEGAHATARVSKTKTASPVALAESHKSAQSAMSTGLTTDQVDSEELKKASQLPAMARRDPQAVLSQGDVAKDKHRRELMLGRKSPSSGRKAESLQGTEKSKIVQLDHASLSLSVAEVTSSLLEVQKAEIAEQVESAETTEQSVAGMPLRTVAESDDNLVVEDVVSKTASQWSGSQSQSEGGESPVEEKSNRDLQRSRFEMMMKARSAASSGKKGSLHLKTIVETQPNPNEVESDLRVSMRKRRRERLQAEFQTKREARLSSAARSITSSSPPLPITSILMGRRNDMQLSAISGVTALSESPSKSPSMISLANIGEVLQVIFLEEYPGLLFLIVLIGIFLLLR